MSTPFLGEIRMFGFNFATKGWAACDGQLLPISQNTALFSLLGTFYGGNGQTNFALPNLQASFVIGTGQGPGLTDRVVGETGGTAAVTLLAAEMASHGHTLTVSDLPADRSNAAGNYLAVPPDPVYLQSAPNASTFPQTALPTGGGQPHNNLSPFLAVNFCIAMQGIFPPRN
jgi:microcystin-dependent protein